MSLMLGLALFFSGAALALAVITLKLRRLARGLYSGNAVPYDYGKET